MIQVCSQCGTRWNVRDRQRAWCPRCHGTLLAPSGPADQQEWGPRPGAAAAGPAAPPRPRLPPGYRWVAVRPGTPPPPRRGRRELGPTPRYQVIPRWGLVEHFDAPAEQQAPRVAGPSATAVRMTLVATMAVLGAAAFVHLVRYVLLIINRTVLLQPLGCRRGHLGRRRGQRRRDVHGRRQRAASDELADRAASGGVRPPRSPGAEVGVGAAGGLPGPGRQPGLGAGLRHRAGRRRGAPAAGCAGRSRCGGWPGCVSTRCRSSRSRPASPPIPRASPTTP